MSVFQLNEWWGVQVASTEEFDFGCLCLGNIDNSVPPCEKIIVGSLEGIIRIYNPSKPQYRIEDLILEESLGHPILQLLVGRFIPSTESLGLAVLHPRKLVVYEVSPHGIYYFAEMTSCSQLSFARSIESVIGRIHYSRSGRW